MIKNFPSVETAQKYVSEGHEYLLISTSPANFTGFVFGVNKEDLINWATSHNHTNIFVMRIVELIEG